MRRFGLRPLARRISRNQDGIAATEFGLIAPVFILLIIGLFDMAHMVYVRSMFDGVVQRAARANSLETADTSVTDLQIFNLMKPVIPGLAQSDFTHKRQSYYDFADIKRPEKFDVDQNGNGICDSGDSYYDENRNNRYDSDIGADGNGGAGDVVMYTVTLKYKPVVKIPFMPAMWTQRTFTATAVKKNQPFADQPTYGTGKKTC